MPQVIKLSKKTIPPLCPVCPQRVGFIVEHDHPVNAVKNAGNKP
jgi:hypothetical protein